MTGFIKAVIGFFLAVFTLIGGTFDRVTVCRDPDITKPFITEDAEALPDGTEPPEELVRISEKLTMPRVTKIAELESVDADLNASADGYARGDLMTGAFGSVFDKLVIFRAGKDTAFALGAETSLSDSMTQKETGYYIPLTVINEIFGSYPDGKAENGEANVKDVAEHFGLDEYHTDAGLVFFSVGAAFDPVKGYYVAEEAEKLWLPADKAEAYSDNMFVDVPNIITNGPNAVTAYSFPELDINANVVSYASQGVGSQVTLGPAIVAGQGEDKNNYTVVRVFDAYQTLHTQFNAYPSGVRGGVQVAAAETENGYAILTAPYTDKSVKELRCYDANGSFLFKIKPSGKAPYAIASGAFLGGEDVFAVTTRNDLSRSRTVEFFSVSDGSLLETSEITTAPMAGTLLSSDSVSENGDALLIFADNNVVAYSLKNGELTGIDTGLKPMNGVYASAFGGYWVTGDAKDKYKALSTVTEYNGGEAAEINVGERENLFFTTAVKEDGKYVKSGRFWHLRTEFGTPAHNNTAPGNTASIRVNDISSFTTKLHNVIPLAYNQRYNNSTYNMWEPCATHRWNQTAGMKNLIDYVDPDTGKYGYATLTKEDERTDYVEFGNSYYNGTYAPYIEAMDRFNYWSRRSYLQPLAKLYREAPEYTAAVSPVHEHEIDAGANTVGDYNPKMIAGFRLYLRDMYGTVENVNRIFGTSFASFEELDAPRDAGRGAWDRYPASAADANPYFTQWSIYNRTIVSQRLVEAYRETLLAGFPPELIKAHQIPEGDAVAGFLGEADTRISPVDVILAAGTGYGGTRYGTFYKDENSFLALANRSGQYNVTLGEYSSMNTDKKNAWKQLKYMFENGAIFTHVGSWAGTLPEGETLDASEEYAAEKLRDSNIPRSASSGGTGDVRAYVNGDTSYNIVEIGSKKSSAGLLKSVNADGSFEGTVYLQPFHAHTAAVDLERGGTASGTGRLRCNITGRRDADGKNLEGINYGDTVDVRVTAKPTNDAGQLTFRVWNGETGMEAVAYTFDVTGDETEYRFTFKNQIYLKDCSVTITYRDVDITDSSVTLIYERTARRYYGETAAQPHKGGVSFDLLS